MLSSLNQWLTHDDLIGVRDEKARRKLLEDERPDWQQFWTQVAALQASLEPR